MNLKEMTLVELATEYGLLLSDMDNLDDDEFSRTDDILHELGQRDHLLNQAAGTLRAALPQRG